MLNVNSSCIYINLPPESNFISSFFDRIRTEIRGGAWCPNGLISPRSRQYLEIDLHDEYLITATESQGRFANSVGVEFVESYLVEYWRSALSRWVKYKDFNGSRVSVRQYQPPHITFDMSALKYITLR